MTKITSTITSVDEDGIAALAHIIVRSIVADYEPMPFAVMKEFGPVGTEAEELVGNTAPSGLPNDVYDLVFARAVELLNERTDGVGLWQPREDHVL
jgi:hypothetical protein